MNKLTPYNGHKSYQHWDVYSAIYDSSELRYHAWICSQDSGLVRAAYRLMKFLPATTANGTRFTQARVREALKKMYYNENRGIKTVTKTICNTGKDTL